MDGSWQDGSSYRPAEAIAMLGRIEAFRSRLADGGRPSYK
jgi:hypothetical protein